MQTAGEEIKMTNRDGEDNETVWGIDESGERVCVCVCEHIL